MPPGIHESLPEAGHCRDEAGHEDGTSATEQTIERHSQPTADECTTEVRRGVHEAYEPGRAFVVVVDTELASVEQLCSIDHRLV